MCVHDSLILTACNFLPGFDFRYEASVLCVATAVHLFSITDFIAHLIGEILDANRELSVDRFRMNGPITERWRKNYFVTWASFCACTCLESNES